MNRSFIKSLILAVAIAMAVGGVLFFIQTVVSPPDNIKTEDVYTADIKKISNSYNPDTLDLREAEKMFDVVVDRAILYKTDFLIDQKLCDNVISSSAEKFSANFIKWSMLKFNQPVWNHSDHERMTRIIHKLRNVKVDLGSKKALESKTLASLTKIESIISEYGKAWKVTEQTSFVPWNYDDARLKRANAELQANKEYLKNCVALVNSLKSVGEKLEKSCYYQLVSRVNKLRNLYSFSSKEAYDNESSRVYDLIREFEKTAAFGVSTSAHAKNLKKMQDSYDRISENYDWYE